jgi:hypothetical protein
MGQGGDGEEIVEQNWISVKERLPEMEEYVLVKFHDERNRCRGKSQHVLQLIMFDGYPMWENFDGNYNFGFDIATHWMQLPQPPEDCTLAEIEKLNVPKVDTEMVPMPEIPEMK